VRLLRIVIWILTATFVVLLFTPLVREMLFRMSAVDSAVP
jgi:hypothetical protein